MDLTSDIPDFVRETFVPVEEAPRAVDENSFDTKWRELGALVLGMVTPAEKSFTFSSIRMSDVVQALGNCATDEHHLWASPTLPPFMRLTTWAHIGSETNFYELAATLPTPTLIIAFQAPHECARSYFYGPQELIAIPQTITAATFVFLLQRVTLTPPTVSNTNAVKKRRSSHLEEETSTDEEDERLTLVQSVEIERAPASTIPVCDRQRMGHTPAVSSASGDMSFDLHTIMTKWKQEGKRPTVEKICDTEHITQRDIKRWLDRQNTTWTKMLIQYGFRDSSGAK